MKQSLLQDPKVRKIASSFLLAMTIIIVYGKQFQHQILKLLPAILSANGVCTLLQFLQKKIRAELERMAFILSGFSNFGCCRKKKSKYLLVLLNLFQDLSR